jgi:hypothetical protein
VKYLSSAKVTCEIHNAPLTERGEHEETEGLDPLHVKVSWNLQDLVMLEAESRNPIMKKAFIISRQTSLAGVHHWQTWFWWQTTASGDTSTGGNFSCLSTFK